MKMTAAECKQVTTMRRQVKAAGWNLKVSSLDGVELLWFAKRDRQMSPEFSTVAGLWAWLQHEVDESQERARLSRNAHARRMRRADKMIKNGQAHTLIQELFDAIR